jgi:hypothetical protein
MATSKCESTAINELIDLARSGKQVEDEEIVDLFRPRPVFQPPPSAAPAQPRRAASGTSPAVPALAVHTMQMPGPALSSIAPLAPSVSSSSGVPSAWDVGQLSSPGTQIPASLRSTTAGVAPPPPRRPGTLPPPIPPAPAGSFARRPDATPAPELVNPALAMHQTIEQPAVYAPPPSPGSSLSMPAPETLAPETLPPLPPLTLTPAGLAPEHLDVDVKVDIDRTGDDWFAKQEQALEQAKEDRTADVNKQQQQWFAGTRLGQQRNKAPSGGTAVVLRTPLLKHKATIPVAVGVGVLAIFAVGALAFSGEGGKKATAASAAALTKTDKTDKTAKVAAKPADKPSQAIANPAASQSVAQAPAPAATETPAAAPAAAGTPNLVSVRFDSTPPGASVVLVDGGRTQFLGTTPVNASVDPSRKYDVMYTLANHPTTLQHLDPASSHHMTAALGGIASPSPTPAIAHAAPARAETPAPAPAPAPAPRAQPAPQHVAAAAPAPAPTPAAAPAPKHQAAPKQAAAADESGDDDNATGPGTLMVASHPQCKIFVDGRDTGLQTPQKGISLPPGAHKVTLKNADQNINKTVTVSISSGVATKVIKNF